MLTNSQIQLKQKYSYIEISDTDFLVIYELAKEEKDFKTSFHKLMLEYIKQNMDILAIIKYLNKLKINKNLSIQLIFNRLNSLFKLLEQLEYSLSEEEVLILLKQPLINNVLKRYFKTSLNHEIENDYNFMNLCNKYQEQSDGEFDLKEYSSISLEDFDSIMCELEKSKIKDSVKMYLLEIKQKPLLSYEEEIKLASKISLGDKEAKKRFIESNLRLVVSIAKRYVNKGMDFLDIIQEGNLGLIKAIDIYDYKKGFKFSTYAYFWIVRYIQLSFANQKRAIRIPISKVDKIFKMQKIRDNFIKNYGYMPSISELAYEMALSEDEVNKLILCSKDIESLDETLDDDSNTTLKDLIVDETTDIEEITLINSSYAKINEALKILKPREKDIIIRRFGLDNGGKKRTLKQVSKQFNISSERIRQLEERSLKYVKMYLENKPAKESLKQLKINLIAEKLFNELYKIYHIVLSKEVLNKIIYFTIENNKLKEEEYLTLAENNILLYLINFYKNIEDLDTKELLYVNIKKIFIRKIKAKNPTYSYQKINNLIDNIFNDYECNKEPLQELSLIC